MGVWKLETAKARLSEVVRQAKNAGPQTITVRGVGAAVVISTEQYRRLTGAEGGDNWVDRFRDGFTGDIELERDDDRGRDLPL